MKSNGLSQFITGTTRKHDKSNLLLDLIITNSKYISLKGPLDHFMSDHQAIFVVKKKRRDDRPNAGFQGRSYRGFDAKVFKDKLLIENMSRDDTEPTVQSFPAEHATS